MSQDARTWPIAHRTAVEAQIPTEVLRQDQSRCVGQLVMTRILAAYAVASPGQQQNGAAIGAGDRRVVG